MSGLRWRTISEVIMVACAALVGRLTRLWRCRVDKLPPNTRIEIEHGRKVVYVTHNTSDAGLIVIRQAFDDAICHHYDARGIGEDIPLYAGTFSLHGDLSRIYTGDVRFTWNPTPRMMARGETESPILDFLEEDEVSSGWTRMGEVIIDTSKGLPSQPAEANQTWSKASGSGWMEDRIASPDVGSGDTKENVSNQTVHYGSVSP